jgi:hypothetical protein
LLQTHHRNLGKRVVKMPKLNFLDAALAASLMGIQTTTQLAIHPLRGALLETLIVSEFLKARFNAGLASNLFFWRDNVRLEVDLLLDEPEGLLPIKIKSSATVTDDLFKGLRKWLAVAGGVARLPMNGRNGLIVDEQIFPLASTHGVATGPCAFAPKPGHMAQSPRLVSDVTTRPKRQNSGSI